MDWFATFMREYGVYGYPVLCAGVLLENGVAVDEGLRASVPGVFAAGDCAAFWSRRYGRRIRVEHWDSAIHAPEVVAANILGGEERYDPVPYFWSEQFGRMVQYCGQHTAADRLIWRGDTDGRDWTACWLAGAGPGGTGERPGVGQVLLNAGSRMARRRFAGQQDPHASAPVRESSAQVEPLGGGHRRARNRDPPRSPAHHRLRAGRQDFDVDAVGRSEHRAQKARALSRVPPYQFPRPNPACLARSACRPKSSMALSSIAVRPAKSSAYQSQ